MNVLASSVRPAPALSRTRQWAATLGATAVSTYALDAVATERAPRSPPRGSCTALRTHWCSGSSRSATSRGARACAGA